ncbi:MAG TPA: DUF4197 domain-containing protein [Flavobacteriaceae bacterium]|nr:DUF4197 domain-containing protein [Flavobacteriaceae bacterium]
MKKFLLILLVFNISACAELQTIAENLPDNGYGISQTEIGNGLKQALRIGITQQVTQLAEENGFYGNELVRIVLPEELQKVENTLRDVGLGNLADQGIEALNDAAEDAVGEAVPIFIDAVEGMTFQDAKNILLGGDRAATSYLENETNRALYNKFQPIIQNSFAKVGADQIWSNLITQYNKIPFTDNVNPDLTDYVTQEALDGVYTMIAVEEKEIRNNLQSRTTDLLRRVFALQD